jgi:hypothetical protein
VSGSIAFHRRSWGVEDNLKGWDRVLRTEILVKSFATASKGYGSLRSIAQAQHSTFPTSKASVQSLGKIPTVILQTSLSFLLVSQLY